MINVHRHNPALHGRLSKLVEAGNVEGLKSALSHLTNNEFRTAGYMLGEEILKEVVSADAFLDFFFGIVPTNSKAYLGTFMKAAQHIYQQYGLELNDARWDQYAETATPIDRKKIVEALLPEMQNVEHAQRLLRLFTDDTVEAQMPFLLNAGTTVCYFILFKSLKKVEDNHAYITQQYIALVRREQKRSYNMASILRHYFGLDNLPGTFSLQLQPYQLSRLDESFETFSKILNQ